MEYDPLGNPVFPTASIHDQYGNPILVGGQVMTQKIDQKIDVKVTPAGEKKPDDNAASSAEKKK